MKNNYSRGFLLLLIVSTFLFFPYFTLTTSSYSQELTEVSGELIGAVQAIKLGEYGTAVDVLSGFSLDNPLGSYVQYLRAEALLGSGDYRKALRVLNGIKTGDEQAPTKFEKYFLKAKILFSLNRYGEASSVAERSHQFEKTETERKKLCDLQLSVALRREKFSTAFEKAIELMNATELRFVGSDRDRLFELVETKIIPEVDFNNQRLLEDLYRYIEILVDYREYSRARSLLLRNMDKWPDSLKPETYFRLAWLDGFKLDFPEEALWTFNRLLQTDLPSWFEAKARYYHVQLKDTTEEDFALTRNLLEVNRNFPSTYYGKLAGAKAFEQKSKGGNLAELDEELERFKNFLSRGTVRDATWVLFFKSFTEGEYTSALHYLQSLESYYDEPPPRVNFWRRKVKNAQAGDNLESYLSVVNFQRSHPLDYYSLLAGDKGWSRGNFDVSDTWGERVLGVKQVENRVLEADLSTSVRRTLQYAIQLKNHELFVPALNRLARIKTDVPTDDYLFLKFQWKKLSEQFRESLKAATKLLEWYYDHNQRPPLNVVKAAFPRYYSSEVKKAAGQFGLPEELIYAVIRQESAFDKQAYSTARAGGLMQVIPSTAKGIAEDLRIDNFRIGDLFKPSVAIEMGSFYVAKQFSRCNDIRLALAAYHGGPGNLQRWKDKFGFDDVDLFIEKIPLNSTKSYVKAVYQNYRIYRLLD